MALARRYAVVMASLLALAGPCAEAAPRAASKEGSLATDQADPAPSARASAPLRHGTKTQPQPVLADKETAAEHAAALARARQRFFERQDVFGTDPNGPGAATPAPPAFFDGRPTGFQMPKLHR